MVSSLAAFANAGRLSRATASKTTLSNRYVGKGRRVPCRGMAEETKTAAAPEKAAVEDKSLEIMRKFSEQYAKTSDTYFCVDKSVTAVVVKVGEPGHVGHTAWQ
mmetsp:Transcript_5130/g.18778  ORF Transcript_5130/g.18778 Transcript_5130/m.18778 type:complete len:104 (-) Transcript_5130:1872-2183(-)